MLAYTYFSSPKEKILGKELQEYELQMALYEKTIQEMATSLSELRTRDKEIYRVIFEAEPMADSSDVRKTLLEKYGNIRGFNIERDMRRIDDKLQILSASMKSQETSFADILGKAQKKEEMLASIPAIQPIANRDLKRVASGFGYRIHPIYKTSKMHTGMDFTAPRGTDIFATGNGRVTFAGRNSGYGNHVIINHGYGYETLYAHMTNMSVRVGETVTRGQKIGTVGSTGVSTSPHLHYEVIKNGNKVNPVYFYYNDLSPEDYERIKELAETNNQSFD